MPRPAANPIPADRPAAGGDAPVPAAVEPASYEAALSELELLVGQMEGGQLPLDRLLESYRRGAELLAYCRARLASVEGQVKVLEDGQLRDWAAS